MLIDVNGRSAAGACQRARALNYAAKRNANTQSMLRYMLLLWQT